MKILINKWLDYRIEKYGYLKEFDDVKGVRYVKYNPYARVDEVIEINFDEWGEHKIASYVDQVVGTEDRTWIHPVKGIHYKLSKLVALRAYTTKF